MEFINVEEFQSQPEDIQEVFMEWWKPSIGDLIIKKETKFMTFVRDSNEDKVLLSGYSYRITEFKTIYIPLFTEGSLRKFIEDKLEQIHYENDGRKIELDITHNNGFTRIEEGVYGSAKGVKRVEWIIENELGKKYDLLQAYWKVALKVAKESAENE